MRSRLTISPRTYERIALAALIGLAVIVFTGAAVRLTGSGLGCPDWPKCYGKVVAPLELHAIIEYGNRVFSGLVGLAAIAAGIGGWLRRPFRWKLAVIGVLLPLGIVAQAILGAFTVRYHLAPGFVMSHYVLSMIILDAAFALYWCARYDPGDRPRATDRTATWLVRGLLPVGALTVLVGTAATAAGPHAGGAGTGDVIHRLDFRGNDTLEWIVARHGTIAALFGVACVALWVLLRARRADPVLRRAVTCLCVLLAIQGIVGIVQYTLKLPSEIVWVHVTLATTTWINVLWAVAAAGRIPPRTAPVGADPRVASQPPARQAELETVH